MGIIKEIDQLICFLAATIGNTLMAVSIVSCNTAEGAMSIKVFVINTSTPKPQGFSVNHTYRPQWFFWLG